MADAGHCEAMEQGASGRHGPRIWHASWLLVLALLHVVAYAYAGAMLDTARDFAFAAAIADGSQFPLRGPIIYAVANTSPIWFYLLAPVLALSQSQAVVALFVGALTATKFAAAWLLGREIGGPRLGLLMAVALALPSWSVAQWLTLTQSNLTESMVLLLLWALLRRWRHGQARDGLLAALAFGLGIASHPTVVLLAPLLAAVWLRDRRLGRIGLRDTLVALLVAALPFVPVLVAEAIDGWPVFARIAGYLGGGAGPLTLARVLDLYLGSVLDGFGFSANFLAGPGARTPMWVLYAGLLACAAIGVGLACVRGPHRALVRLALAAVLLLPLLLALTRPTLPGYMLGVWQAAFAVLLALGWFALLGRGRGRHLVLGIGVLLSATSTLSFAGRMSAGYARLPTDQIGAVERRQGKVEWVATLSNLDADRIADAACAAERPQVFHADIATLLDVGHLRSVRLRCPAADLRLVGGAGLADADHWVAINSEPMRRLGLGNLASVGGRRLVRVATVIHPQASITVPDGLDYPPRPFSRAPITARTLRFTARRDQVVLLGRPQWPYNDIDSVRATASGIAVAEQWFTTGTSALVAPEGVASPVVDWEVHVESRNPETFEVLLLDRAARH